jgi:hypothetical protein
VLVSDDEIRAAQALMIEITRNLVEAAGAASLAAALRLRETLEGSRVADAAPYWREWNDQENNRRGVPSRGAGCCLKARGAATAVARARIHHLPDTELVAATASADGSASADDLPF